MILLLLLSEIPRNDREIKLPPKKLEETKPDNLSIDLSPFIVINGTMEVQRSSFLTSRGKIHTRDAQGTLEMGRRDLNGNGFSFREKKAPDDHVVDSSPASTGDRSILLKHKTFDLIIDALW